jgi:uncharacterized membrane-anchored protein YjiN (DUF445 family)
MMCPHCGWTYDPAVEGDSYNLVPDHWFRGEECPGHNQHPRNAESDKRPLWRDEQVGEMLVDVAAKARDSVRQAYEDKIAALRQSLTSLACYAVTARQSNTHQWMQGLVEKLNNAAETLEEPGNFVWHHIPETGECWITCEDKP